MNSLTLTAPTGVGTRELVRTWLDGALDRNLSGISVSVDCHQLRAASPSFVDELIQIVVVERNASRVEFLRATPRTADLIRRSAVNRRLEDRVDVKTDELSLYDRIKEYWLP